MDEAAFESLVAEALDSLPADLLSHLENVEVVIEQWPSPKDLKEAGLDPADRHGLLGLYVGVPLTERDTSYAGVLPDRIALYQKAIEAAAGGDPAIICEEIKATVIHELAHFYGISDERLDEMGWG